MKKILILLSLFLVLLVFAIPASANWNGSGNSSKQEFAVAPWESPLESVFSTCWFNDTGNTGDIGNIDNGSFYTAIKNYLEDDLGFINVENADNCANPAFATVYFLSLSYSANADRNNNATINVGDTITFTLSQPTGTIYQNGGWNDTPPVSFNGIPFTWNNNTPNSNAALKTWSLQTNNIVSIECDNQSEWYQVGNVQAPAINGDPKCKGVQSLGAYLSSPIKLQLTSSDTSKITCDNNTSICTAVSPASGVKITVVVPAQSPLILFSRVCQGGSLSSKKLLSLCGSIARTRTITLPSLTLPDLTGITVGDGGGGGEGLPPTPTPSPTPAAISSTPVPTVIPNSWIRLNNLSFSHGQGTFNNPIPSTTDSADAATDLDSNGRFITGGLITGIGDAPGVITTYQGLNLGAGSTSAKNWKSDLYLRNYVFKSDVYQAYVKARKQYISAPSLAAVTTNKVNILEGPLIIDGTAETTLVGKAPTIVIVHGDITIQPSDDNFNGGSSGQKKSIALIATGTLSFDEDMQVAHGIFIASNVNTGGPKTNQLKIFGNLITTSYLVNLRKSSDSKVATLYISAVPKYYLELLPLLSVAKYEFRQLQ